MLDGMDKHRLEAFSDGVIAIILTITVLDLKVPKEHSFEALGHAWPVFGAYALSYWNIFLIWLNHHNIFAPIEAVSRKLLVANGLLLFLASFIPFVTGFASDAHWTEPVSVVIYGLLMALVSVAFAHLRRVANFGSLEGQQREQGAAEVRWTMIIGLAFLVGAGAAWFVPRWALVIYALVPLLRLVQRRRLAASGASGRWPT
jgi:uncharacterized membrane protein